MYLRMSQKQYLKLLSQILNVWYIYLRLPYKLTKFIGKYTIYIECLGIEFTKEPGRCENPQLASCNS